MVLWSHIITALKSASANLNTGELLKGIFCCLFFLSMGNMLLPLACHIIFWWKLNTLYNVIAILDSYFLFLLFICIFGSVNSLLWFCEIHFSHGVQPLDVHDQFIFLIFIFKFNVLVFTPMSEYINDQPLIFQTMC